MTHPPARGTPGPTDIRPVVRPPWPGPPSILVASVLCLLGMGVLFAIEGPGQRHPKPHPDADAVAARGFAPPETPELVVPPPPPAPPPAPPEVRYVERPAPPPVIQYVDRTPPPPPEAQPANMYGPKLAEPVLPIDLAEVGQATSAPTGDDAPAQAVTLHNRSMLVPQGSMIPAVIESSIDSTEPGPVRAVTSGDTRGFDGTRILIPRGSRLVGDLHAGSGADQDRATVVWTRLVRPDGIAIRFSAPSTDFEGGVGVKGKVNNHILARVGAAVLQTGLTVGTLMAAAQSSNGSIILGLPVESASGVAQTAIPPPPSAPTITVRAGTPIMIFVNRDLDFTGALPKR